MKLALVTCSFIALLLGTLLTRDVAGAAAVARAEKRALASIDERLHRRLGAFAGRNTPPARVAAR